ncbi:MAG: DeoR/GlpR transcriptional regulator, partial [Opitutaceae bacterium]|nr:DeoR/GlpR transcriptional regulator [Opitutaceae bacterium]
MFAQERHRRVTDLLAERQKLTLEELCAVLGVSPATVRRDLQYLERIGRVVRTHGGILHPAYLGGERPFHEK